MNTYTPTIGIEVHAELKTKSKMFCGCKNDPHASSVNTNICPVCMAHPGTLPAVNKEAVRMMVQIGTAVGGSVASYSEFDRKNYFYPDIPKAYQLSQYAYPFVSGGELAGVALTRVHLEEDTARSQHDRGEGSVVDFNRAGVPLMELVTEPVIHDAKTAAHFGKELQLLLRTLGVSDANMEKGEMRVEANISISKTDELGTKVEVKNLNSFKAVEQAIEYEIKRQRELLERGEVIIQETRGWDENKNKTFSQRTKETAEDYRYFPDPDIPKFDLALVSEFNDSRINENMPELPNKTRDILSRHGVKAEQIEVLLQQPEWLAMLRATIATKEHITDTQVVTAANYLTSDIAGLLDQGILTELAIDKAPQFAELIGMVTDGQVTSRVAKDLLPEVLSTGVSPLEMAENKGLLQKNSPEELKVVIDAVIANNPAAVTEYKAGKEAALKFLLGQVMKESKGSANPQVATELLTSSLS